MSEEVCAPSGSLHQGDIPVRPRQLENQTGNSWSATDVEQWGGRLGDYGEEHQRLHHEMPDSRPRIGIGRETADLLPAVQLAEVRGHLCRKLGGQRQGQALRRGPEGATEI
jgi:hypothetical protein